MERFANQSVSKIFKITFIVLLSMFLSPFIAYLILKNKGALEVTFVHLFQIYGYSLAIFIPLGFIQCLFYPLNRLRLILTIAGGCISIYYVFKEMREYLVKYLESQDP